MCLGGQVCELDTLLYAGSAKGEGMSLCKKQIRGKDKRKDRNLRQHVLKDLQRSRGKTIEHTGEFIGYR